MRLKHGGPVCQLCVASLSRSAPLMLSEDGGHAVRSSDRRKQVHQQVGGATTVAALVCLFVWIRFGGSALWQLLTAGQ